MSAPQTSATTTVRVQAISDRPGDVKELELASVDGAALEPFDVGAHIDLHLPNGMIRSYSLLGQYRANLPYRLAVALARDGRGGSHCVHDSLRAGQILPIGPVRNTFGLVDTAEHSVLIAGGIGITPLLGMVARLQDLKRSWTLYYCVRTREAASFLVDLDVYGSQVLLHFDDENDGRVLDLRLLAGRAPLGTHFYCCGPSGMLSAFRDATSDRDEAFVHIESFEPHAPDADAAAFEIELKRSGMVLPVPSHRTILEVVTDAGIDVASSCQQGTCGTCETNVLAGEPDHLDDVLTESERASGKTMMICCSRSKSPRLVLDL